MSRGARRPALGVTGVARRDEHVVKSAALSSHSVYVRARQWQNWAINKKRAPALGHAPRASRRTKWVTTPHSRSIPPHLESQPATLSSIFAHSRTTDHNHTSRRKNLWLSFTFYSSQWYPQCNCTHSNNVLSLIELINNPVLFCEIIN